MKTQNYPHNKRIFTLSEFDEIIRLLNSGMPYYKVAQVFNVTSKVITRTLTEANIPIPLRRRYVNITPELSNIFVNLHNQHKSIEEISRITNIGSRVIKNTLKLAGITPRPAYEYLKTRDDDKICLMYFTDKYSYKEIANLLNYNVCVVKQSVIRAIKTGVHPCKECSQFRTINEHTRKNKFYAICNHCASSTSDNKKIAYNKKRYQDVRNAPSKLLHKNFSSLLRTLLKRTKVIKSKKTFECVGYTIEKLKQHIELLFEWWMTWDNWGVYDAKIWDDNDPSTWKWQLDHIIPASLFKFSSVEDEEFKKCWTLENLRPLSAKINYLEGVRGTRHQGLRW